MLDAVTTRGLEGVRVELLPQERLTLTSADGRWVFAAVQPGEYTIRVAAEGYEVVTYTVVLSIDRVGRPLTIPSRRPPAT